MNIAGTKYKGLSSEEVLERQQKYGKNNLPEKKPPSSIQIFVNQLKSPLVYILLVAAAVTFILHETSDTAIILFAVFINTILGFIQEEKAGKSLAALKGLLHPTTHVIRDGEYQVIDIQELVPGDIVVLNQGDKVPADGKLLEANRMYFTEAMLTGESVPIDKGKGAKVFMGTVTTAGRGVLEVEVTGAQTEIGKIAESVQGPSEDTPLKRQLVKFSKQLSALVLATTVVVFIVGLFTGMKLEEIFVTSVALAVSAIPEGLLVALTVVLAIGMQRILKRQGLVRNLVSAEPLGGVTTICVDKTGTLTQGQMQVVDHIGDEDILALQGVIANDLDDPLVIAADEWGRAHLGVDDELFNQYERLDSIPFSSEERVFVSLNKYSSQNNIIFVNGAPEFVIEWSDLSDSDKKDLKEQVKRLSSEGKRLVGYAQKPVSTEKTVVEIGDAKANLKWVGILAFNDPVRPDVSDALKKAQEAGIKIIVITGDYAITAQNIMKELGIGVEQNSVILGNELESFSEEELDTKLKLGSDVKLFARTTPHQKMSIIKSLKRNGEVVAMMGDGVNDAPALARADIGIVVGEATDVAKETADLVLLDSSFSTIVAAIEEGRGIFDNLRKIILFLLADAFQAIITILLALPLVNSLPVTASQILWINLISDGFPNLALTIDPKVSGIMKRNPRPPEEKLVSPWIRNLIAIISVMGGIVGFGLFYYVYKTSGDLTLARSVAFVSLGMNSSIYVFSVRTLTQPVWKQNPFSNNWLVIAVVASLVFLYIPFATEWTRGFFGIVQIGMYWLVAFGASLGMFILIEFFKFVLRKTTKAVN